MVEDKKLEFAILNLLLEEDEFNTGLVETDLLSRLRKISTKLPNGEIFRVNHHSSVIMAHCKLLKQRGYIEYGSHSFSGGNLVGPILPGSYDFLEQHKF